MIYVNNSKVVLSVDYAYSIITITPYNDEQ